MNPEQVEHSFSPLSALALSNMEEGMGHNAERAQVLQEELVQRRADYTTTLLRLKPFKVKKLFWLI